MSRSVLSTTLVSCGLASALAVFPACRSETREPARVQEPRAATSTAEPARTDPAMPAGSPAQRERNEAAKVLATLHQDNQNEIELGKLAQKNGASAHTREFGAMLVKDHQAADRKLMDFVKAHDVALASGDAAKQAEDKAREGREVLEKLRSLRGSEFDEEFGEAMKKDHEKAVALVKDAQEDSDDPKFDALLAELQPALEKHLEHAKMVEEGKAAATTDEERAARQGRRPR